MADEYSGTAVTFNAVTFKVLQSRNHCKVHCTCGTSRKISHVCTKASNFTSFGHL